MPVVRISLMLLLTFFMLCSIFGRIYLEEDVLYFAGNVFFLKTMRYLLNDCGLASLSETLQLYCKKPVKVIYNGHLIPVTISEMYLIPESKYENIPDKIQIENIDGFVVLSLIVSHPLARFIYRIVPKKTVLVTLLFIMLLIMEIRTIYTEEEISL